MRVLKKRYGKLYTVMVGDIISPKLVTSQESPNLWWGNCAYIFWIRIQKIKSRDSRVWMDNISCAAADEPLTAIYSNIAMKK